MIRSLLMVPALFAAAALTCVACERGGASSSSSAQALPGDDVNVPTQAQADNEAAAAINDANADAEFQKLQREVDSQTTGD